MENGVERCFFLSANGTKLGSMSANDMRTITQAGVNNGTLPTDSSELSSRFAQEFNIYRGLNTTNTPAQASVPTNSTTNATTVDKDNYPSDLAALINGKRTKNNVETLSYNGDIQSLADTRAKEISQTWSHTRPDGTKVNYAEIITRSSTPNSAFNNFSNSSAHNDIMLSENYTGYAIGCYQADNGYTYWVVLLSK